MLLLLLLLALLSANKNGLVMSIFKTNTVAYILTYGDSSNGGPGGSNGGKSDEIYLDPALS